MLEPITQPKNLVIGGSPAQVLFVVGNLGPVVKTGCEGALIIVDNDVREFLKMAAVLDQMGKALLFLIAVVAAAAAEDGDMVSSQLDIKDGYWHMLAKR